MRKAFRFFSVILSGVPQVRSRRIRNSNCQLSIVNCQLRSRCCVCRAGLVSRRAGCGMSSPKANANSNPVLRREQESALHKEFGLAYGSRAGGSICCGMIATGNHRIFDSLRGAPPSPTGEVGGAYGIRGMRVLRLAALAQDDG